MTYLPRLQAIPTTYSGILFRSKLEAQYAAMFDILNVLWEYEPDRFKSYNIIRHPLVSHLRPGGVTVAGFESCHKSSINNLKYHN